ncbi:mediator of RNA polymerase II transcription subunit 25 isoform X2 [Physcomitrium patens]|uniref:mediator of RNA polymerase II transcription subunit 25 isoform X2 n=1 Tax=Physcomitrium patens TaxID=3218 RepID=UPI000D17CF08|nr:mediator of RNA polymerase II transcription subunit 25-like isoform X2 [Physcomitrium patens]|eukprot:XP_024364981.1 mediator of RNA polymerase II transcription subunit 25-like isoform X2 [Physcomitrella patens]
MMSQRQLVVAVEATGALGPFWSVLLTEYVDKIVRAFFDESNNQKNGSSPGEVALVVFNTHGSHSDFLLRQSGWTSSMDLFFKWLSALTFEGGGFSEAAVAEALAEALMMCCPGPKPPTVPHQKHCLLIAASNPYRLPTPVMRPPVILLSTGQAELQSEQWWLADAETVAKAFPPCQVSLSVIAPRQLPLLRSIYNGAKRNPRAADTGPDFSKLHLVLISEGFPEGKLALRRASGASNTAVSSSLSAKLEPLLATTTSAPSQPAVRPMPPSTAVGAMMGRQAVSNGSSGVTMENQSLSHNTVAAVPLPSQHPSSSGVSGTDTMQTSVQTSDTSASSQAKVGPVGGNPSTLGHVGTLTQPHKMPGGAVANGGPAVPSGASSNPTAPSSLTSGPATIIPGNGNVLTTIGSATTVGMNTGIGHSSIVSPLQQGVGQLPVSGAGQPQAKPLGAIAGMGVTTTALGTAGVNAGVNSMPPSSGFVQPVQPVQPLAPGIHGVTQTAQSATPPQQPSGSMKYTKLWEGILAGQRQQKPVPICKLEGYRQTSSSEKLAADWPPTMQIVRLIAQEYMNSKEYQGKAELLVFRPLSSHGFLVQLAEKKLCAVIQLPSQTLLLASTDKPGRMIGMLFPGDMVVFKPNVAPSSQQPTGAVPPMAGTGQAMGQTLGQSNFSQGQLQAQMHPQQLNAAQQMTAQQLNAQQMGPQQLNSQQLNAAQQMNTQQQMNAQQMGVQQMNPQQLNAAQQMNTQQQLNAQQMGVQQMNPQQLNAAQQMNTQQQLSAQQMGMQQMNPQQLNAAQQMSTQQMNPQQMSAQQMNPQQMNVQQINPQQMNVQHMNTQQMSPQQARPQIMPGPASLQGSGYLP